MLEVFSNLSDSVVDGSHCEIIPPLWGQIPCTSLRFEQPHCRVWVQQTAGWPGMDGINRATEQNGIKTGNYFGVH